MNDDSDSSGSSDVLPESINRFSKGFQFQSGHSALQDVSLLICV